MSPPPPASTRPSPTPSPSSVRASDPGPPWSSAGPVPVTATEVVLNGSRVELTHEPHQPLLETLRDRHGLTGTKMVCEVGTCGACTVLVDDRAVYACLVYAGELGGRRVDTIEGLGDGADPGPLQRAFVDCDALQCGFCTPGQIMSLEALRRAEPEPTRAEIEAAVTGNLCRCGAYRHILDAATVALGAGGDESGGEPGDPADDREGAR